MSQESARPQPQRPKPVEDHIFDGKAMAVGLVVAAVIFSLAFLWRVKAIQGARRADIRDFEFSMAEPNQEEIKVPNPARDFLRVADPESLNGTASEERPDVHFSRVPSDTPVYSEVIEARNPGRSRPRTSRSSRSTSGTFSPAPPPRRRSWTTIRRRSPSPPSGRSTPFR